MSGTLPGVGVPQRRKAPNRQRTGLLRESEPSILDMDQTALKARLRLHHTLSYFHHSSRLSGQNQDGSYNGCKRKAHIKSSRSGSKFLGMSWNFQLNKCKTAKKCSVCLETLQDEQQVIHLSCSHKYHSNCLLPWLVANRSCPDCRTIVHY